MKPEANMLESPLVSVIVPVYNVEAYLRECLDSVIAQTYQNLEIILVNDGSTDSSGRICDEYAVHDSRIKVIAKPNGGLSSARNAGMKSAHGTYIYFMDSDDWIQPETISCCLENVVSSNADFCFFDADSFDESGYNRPQRYHRSHFYQCDDGLTILSQLCMSKEYHSSVYLMLFNAFFLKSNNIFFYEGIVYEDMLFTFQTYALASKVTYINRSFYQRRYRDKSIMTSQITPLKFSSSVKVYEQLLHFCKENDLLTEDVALAYIARSAFNVMNIFSHLPSTGKKECKRLLSDVKCDILKHNAFDDRALHMRCHGFFPWLCYKLYQKSIGRLLKDG